MQLQLKNHAQSTMVPNRFIESCIGAPENYIGVYLLGIMHSSAGGTDSELLCARLGMSMTEVMQAMEYWQKKGLARIINDTGIMGFDFGDFLPARSSDVLYTEREYNQMLQALFGSRQLSPQEYLKIYDFTSIFGLPKNVVPALVEYCILLKGRRVSVSYMDKVAQSWAEESIDTPEKAREKLEAHKTAASGVLRVLGQLGMSSRGPTQDEYALFLKWTEEWGFTLDAVLTACAHTTSAREPSMKYLDRILERLKDQDHLTSRTISEAAAQSESVFKTLKELMHIVGEPTQKPSFEHESLYQKWTSVYGFNSDMLLLAARQPGIQGRKPFVNLDAVLTDWYNNRIDTIAAAKKHMAAQADLDKRLSAVFDAAGITRGITDASRKLYARWHEAWGLSDDAILLAAEISSLSDNPYRYLGTILTNWHNAGVKSLTDAQSETKKRTGNGRSNIGAKPAHFEHPVEDYDHLAVNLFEDEGA
jgi:DnaD/phage-associated family protein